MIEIQEVFKEMANSQIARTTKVMTGADILVQSLVDH